MNALLSTYYFQKGMLKKAEKNRQSARKDYSPKMAKKDEQINTFMARMEFAALERPTRRYMGLRLEKDLDNKVVVSKTKRLEKLEKAYLAVIRHQSPKWALASIYRSYEINGEFARFLKEAPLPELTAEQKDQYMNVVNQQADRYLKKADRYHATAIEQAHTWEVTDPELTAFYLSSSGTGSTFEGAFSGTAGPGEELLYDESLKGLYERLMKTPKDIETLFELAGAYAGRSDYPQTILVVRKALDESTEKERPLRASLYNLLGLSFLYTGDDDLAKEAFRKAIDNDPGHLAAKGNLAALLSHYGHEVKAGEVLKSLPDLTVWDNENDWIHPKVRELYYAKREKPKKKDEPV